ncbi:Hypothetical predicted protein [Podarcis lilfordi]|uniref:Uncharacterized protein n=1 Tax=Podarcis lilfordi TaxID=74358 RepID=A0AA35L2D0_9SAUR|nr:Hypothetical predicted protein [Podarcis lilfordi]
MDGELLKLENQGAVGEDLEGTEGPVVRPLTEEADPVQQGAEATSAQQPAQFINLGNPAQMERLNGKNYLTWALKTELVLKR